MSVDAFMKISPLQGEAMDLAHKGEIDVLAWSWGVNQSGTMHTGGGGGSGKANIQDMSFTKWTDKSSAHLILSCCNGKQFKEAILTVRKAGENPLEYVKIRMTDVIITSINTGGTGNDDRLTENVTLNFAKVRFEYQPQSQDGSADGGSIPVGWDIAANTAL